MNNQYLFAIALCITPLTGNAMQHHSPNVSALAPVDQQDPLFLTFALAATRSTRSRPASASSHASSGSVTPTAGTPQPVTTKAPAEPTILLLGAGAAGEKKQS